MGGARLCTQSMHGNYMHLLHVCQQRRQTGVLQTNAHKHPLRTVHACPLFDAAAIAVTGTLGGYLPALHQC